MSNEPVSSVFIDCAVFVDCDIVHPLGFGPCVDLLGKSKAQITKKRLTDAEIEALHSAPPRSTCVGNPLTNFMATKPEPHHNAQQPPPRRTPSNKP